MTVSPLGVVEWLRPGEDARVAGVLDRCRAIGATRLRTLSYGEERPQCSDGTESCWARNRRAHFVVTSRANVG